MGARRILRLTNQGQIEFLEDSASGVNKIALKAPATLAGDITWTLPAADSVGVFKSDGVGGITIGTFSLDQAYDLGSTITVDAGAITLNVTANTNGLRIFKSGAGTGSPLSIENDGTGPLADLKQDGAELVIDADRSLGGSVARFRTTGASVSSNITVECDAQARRAVLGSITSGNIFVGSDSAHAFEIRTSNVARITVAAAAAEVAIGGATASGFELSIYGDTSTALQMVGNAGELLRVFQNTTLLSGFTGATYDSTDVIPAGAIVLDIAFRITTEITGPATSISCGPVAATTRYINAVGPAFTAGITYRGSVNGAETQARPYAVATPLRFTATGGNFTAGAMKITVSYIQVFAATS